MAGKIGVIAFSGGLDTSFLVPYCREQFSLEEVITCTVNTGGFDADEQAQIAERSKEVGADEHVLIDGQQEFYRDIIRFLIYGNVHRDGYPISVGAERLVQARAALKICQDRGASYFFHGSTGAGNDQYRFDLAAHVLSNDGLECRAPVRENNFTREFTTNYLSERGVGVATKNTNYSYNVGLWGVSIGGKETHGSSELIPEDAWYSQPETDYDAGLVQVEFDQGQISSVKFESEQEASEPVTAIQLLTGIGNKFGIGRHYHIGTSIPGKKGRLAYESPAADIIYEAHRTLEKLTLTQAQISGKQFLANEFGRLIHEAKFFDPYLSDIAAFLENSQKRVTGVCRVHLSQGRIDAVTADSPFNLLSAKGAKYGEVADFYTGIDAAGAAKLNAFEQKIYHSFKD